VTAFRDGLRADLATRRSGDGRQPVDNCTEFFDMGVHQVRAANGASSAPTFGPTRPTPAVLEADELTVLTSWAEAIAEVLAYVPKPCSPTPSRPWRAALGIAEPSRPLSRAIDSMQTPVRSAIAAADEPTLSGVLLAAVARGPGEHELDALARRVLQSALEQRQVRLTRTPGGVATDEPDPVSTSRRHPA
jgi:hypothetical protein